MLSILQKWFLLLKWYHNLLSVLKDIECTDCEGGYGRKIINLLFTEVHHGQLLVSSSVFLL
jgi:hypothetical protein